MTENGSHSDRDPAADRRSPRSLARRPVARRHHRAGRRRNPRDSRDDGSGRRGPPPLLLRVRCAGPSLGRRSGAVRPAALRGERSAPGGVAQRSARQRHTCGGQRADAPTECRASDGVDVVEAHDTGRGDAVLSRREVKLGDELTPGARERGDHDRADTVGDWVSGEHEDGAVSARGGGEPDLTPLHCSSRSNPPPVPTRQSPRVLAHRRSPAISPISRRRGRLAAPPGVGEAPREGDRSDRCPAKSTNVAPRRRPRQEPES